VSTQPIAICVVLGLALLILFVGWSALAVSQREEREQQQWIETMAAIGQQQWPQEDPSAKGDYPADEDNNEA
jgi:hypothetical protein